MQTKCGSDVQCTALLSYTLNSKFIIIIIIIISATCITTSATQITRTNQYGDSERWIENITAIIFDT